MIRSAVTVSLVDEARGGPFVFWGDLPGACRTAKELGFDGVEIFAPGPAALEPKALKKLLDEVGLALAAVGTGAGWVKQRLHLCLPDAAERKKAKEFIRSMIDVAGPFGAPAIVGSMQGRFGDGVDQPTAQGYLGEALRELAEHARQYSVPLIIEPLNRYETNLINTIEAGVQLIESLSSDNLKLLPDLFHMNIEEVNIAAALKAAGKHIGHLHFVDTNRRAMGFGHLHWRPIAAVLTDIGFQGFASAEALPWPDSSAAAKQTITAFCQSFRAG